jgi:hypothetical protein
MNNLDEEDEYGHIWGWDGKTLKILIQDLEDPKISMEDMLDNA